MTTKKKLQGQGNSKQFLLITSVGDSPEPVATSIYYWQPKRILFVQSDDIADGPDRVLSELKKKGYKLSREQYKKIELSDTLNFSKCVLEMVNELTPTVADWCATGEDFECIVDFTGGTKCMSCALTLVARTWRKSSFSYVVGDISSGSEQIVHSANPWNALGYQAVEDAKEAFDRNAFSEGSRMLTKARDEIRDNGALARALNALAMFMDAYDLWSRFEYGKAFRRFEICEGEMNNLVASLQPISRRCIASHIGEAKFRLKTLKERSDRPTRELLEDLIADASRRRHEGRHVDAVARLYRAVELMAQLRMWKKYGISTSNVLIDELPKSMRARLGEHSEDCTVTPRCPIALLRLSIWSKTQSTGETVALGLQESYEFLIQKSDPLGKRFKSLRWNGSKSPLSMRNNSIAGHGFAPVSEKISDELWKGTLELAELSEEQVFRFPRLGPQDDS